MSRYATFCHLERHVLSHCRFHNRHLHQPVREDFRRLAEKVAKETLTGDEPHIRTFQATTPPEVDGAVAEVKVRT